MQGRLVDTEKKNRIQFFPEKKWKEEILIAKKSNLKLMEWTINIENIKKNPLYNPNETKKLKKFLKKNKFKVQSVTCDFFMQKPFFKSENKVDHLNLLKKIIVNAQKVGVNYFIIPLVDNSSIKNKKKEKELIQGMQKFSNLLYKNNRILFETDYKPEKVLPFIKKFDKKFGINYDTGNSASLNYNFADEKKYFMYVHNIHIKDRLKYGKTVRLGKGNWKPRLFFNFLRKIKYKKNMILQTARSSNNNHLEEILLNLSFIKRFI